MREVRRGEDGSLRAAYGDGSASVRSTVAKYMNTAPVVLASPEIPDGASAGRDVRPGAFRSDGEWLWSDAGAKTFADVEIDLEPEFVAHAIKKHAPPKELSPEQFEAARQLLTSAK